MKIRQLFVCLALTFNCFLTAQQFPFYHYSLERELSGTAVYDLAQDHEGYIWIATSRGVSRFDGYSFRNFTVNDGLTDYNVYNLTEDRFGRMWFRTGNNRLCYYSGDRIVTYPYNDTILKYAEASKLRTLDVASDSSLLLGYYGKGLMRISTSGQLTWLSPRKELLNCFLYVTSGAEWNGFCIGVNTTPAPGANPLDSIRTVSYRINGSSGNFRYHYYKKPGSTELYVALQRRNGNCCIYTGNVFIEIAPGKTPVVVNLRESALRIYEDQDSCLWISHENGGVTRYAPNATPVDGRGHDYLPGWRVTAILQDKEGGCWLGSFEDGFYYAPSLSAEYLIGGQEEHISVLDITGDQEGRMYANTEKGTMRSDKNGKWIPFSVAKQQPDNQCFLLQYDTVHNELLMGLVKGPALMRVDSTMHTKRLTQNYIVSAIIADDTVFMLSREGVSKVSYFNGGEPELTFVHHPNVNYGSGSMCWSNGHLWSGSADGFGYIDGNDFVLANPDDSLLKPRTFITKAMGRNRILTALPGKGVVIYTPASKRSLLIGASKGLTGNFVRNAFPLSDSSLWLTTEFGFSFIMMNSDTSCTVRNYSGLYYPASDKVNSLFVSGQELWLGTNAGLLRILPCEVKKNITPPPVHLLSVLGNDSLLPLSTAETVVPYTINSFRISFVGLAYRMHGKVKYHYCLEGFSKDTVSTFSTEALFLSLPPGQYVFKVWAENEDGVWSSKPASFAFTILPPFWKTVWFITLTIVVILLAIVITLVRIFRRVQRENKMRENLLEYQQQALVSQINPHFIFNSLNTIQSYMFREDKENSARFLSRFSKLMRMSLDHSRLKTVPLPDELSLIRVYLELEAMRFPETLKWSIDVAADIPQEKLEVPSMLIQPYIENAIKHGIMNRPGEKGEVIVRLKMQEKFLLCTIEDNGVGRAAAAKAKTDPQHHSAGSTITEQRLRLICRAMHCPFLLEFSDRLDHAGNVAGTIVKFGLPYRVL